MMETPDRYRTLLFTTAPYACSYLPGEQARSQVAAVSEAALPAVYPTLVRQGFRRSGVHVYRPHCDGCKACESLRIPVLDFQPTRSQKRSWKQHRHLLTTEGPVRFDPDHFSLYTRYQAQRHAGGGMDWSQEQAYREFLLTTPVNTRLIEFRHRTETTSALEMVSVVDVLDDGLSAVYTFFNPSPGLSLGTFGVLWLIGRARELGLPFVYLGYWIESSRKMAYKARFRPHERHVDGVWKRWDGPEPGH